MIEPDRLELFQTHQTPKKNPSERTLVNMWHHGQSLELNENRIVNILNQKINNHARSIFHVMPCDIEETLTMSIFYSPVRLNHWLSCKTRLLQFNNNTKMKHNVQRIEYFCVNVSHDRQNIRTRTVL